ncbi:MAG: hypothetical protein KBF26_03075 [Opitutaceae bacterium]|nr:hypothetical protein [Opitutaceae bacterium]
MKNRAKKFLVVSFVGFLWLVTAQTFFNFLPAGPKLRGVTEAPPAPRWDLASFSSGTAFRGIEDWFNARIGLRNFWVRLDNHVNYALFKETALREQGTRVVAGEDDWLYEHHYIRYAVTPGAMTDAELRAAIARIRSVQDKLARRGIPFELVIGPSKVEVYPEHAPKVFFGGRRPDQVTTNFERARPLLQEYGINFYDAPARYQAWKKTMPDNLFSRAGTHWSYYSVYYVLNELRARLNPMMRRPIPELKIKQLLPNSPRMEDNDLLSLMNLLTIAPYEHPTPFPDLVPQTELKGDQLPRILWVHDSFGWMPINLLYNAKAVRPSESLYYFSLGVYDLPGITPKQRDLKKLDWEHYLKDYDAVVMVFTEIAFDYVGWGFFETLDQNLK